MKKIKKFFKNIFNKEHDVLSIMIGGFSVVLILLVSVLFGYAFTSKGLIVATAKQKVAGYYLVEANNFKDYDEAVAFASSIQNKGGAGHIRFDEGYRVFLSCYESENEAKAVIEKLEDYPQAKIYYLAVEDFDFNNGFSANINNCLKNNILTFNYTIKSLIGLNIELDKGEKTETDIRKACLFIKEEVKGQIDNFMNYYWVNSTLLKYKNYINDFYKLVDTLTELNISGYEFSSILKYQTISLAFKLQDIMNTI